MRSGPLSPAEVARIVAVYEATGNNCETGRQCGVPESTVRYVLKRARAATRRELHAHAVDVGIREARRALRAAVKRAREMLREPLEPRDVHSLAQAASLATVRFLDMKMARLGRDEARSRIAAAREKARSLVQWDEVLAAATPEERDAVYEVAERVRERQRGQTAEPLGGAGDAPTPESGEGR